MKRSQPKIKMLLIRRTSTGKIKFQIGDHPGDIIVVLGGDGSKDGDVDIAITGAGHAFYIDTVTDHLVEAFRKTGGQILSIENVQHLIEKTIRRFYKDHVLPFSAMAPHERPDVAMLVAYRCNDTSGLFASELTAVRRQHGHATVGVGSTLAETLLNRLEMALHDVRMAQLLAAYIVFLVKESIDGCGKFTTIEALPNVGRPHVSFEQIIKLETVFRSYLAREKEFLTYAFTAVDQPASTDKSVESLEKFRADCLEILGA